MAFRPRTWRTIDRRRAGFRKSFRRVFRRALNAQIKPFLDSIQNMDVNNTFITDVVIDNTPLERAYEQLYKTVGLEFARHHRNEALKKANITTKEDNDFWDSQILLNLQSLIESGEIGSQIRAIGDTSKAHLQRLLNDLITEVQELGLGTNQAQTMLRDRLNSRWHRDMRFRTERIVRTETTRASNFGSLEGIKSTGIPMWKFWVATPDTRTREAHAMADGQRRDLNEPFEVDGELLMYPGDTSLGATAGNIINCRCAVTYQVKE